VATRGVMVPLGGTMVIRTPAGGLGRWGQAGGTPCSGHARSKSPPDERLGESRPLRSALVIPQLLQDLFGA
jgi:hypothetical protein